MLGNVHTMIKHTHRSKHKYLKNTLNLFYDVIFLIKYSTYTKFCVQEPANYNFGYMVNDYNEGTDFGHHEERLEDRAQGQYHVVLPDGRKQVKRFIFTSAKEYHHTYDHIYFL